MILNHYGVIYLNLEQTELGIQRLREEILTRLENNFPVIIHHPAVHKNIDITNLFTETKLKTANFFFPRAKIEFSGLEELRDFKTSWNSLNDKNFIFNGGTYIPPKILISDKAKKLSQKEKEKKRNKNKAQKKARRVQRLIPNPKICLQS